MRSAPCRFGDRLVTPATNCVHNGADQRQMEPCAMDVPVALAARPDEVIATEQLLLSCWQSNIGGDNPVHKTSAQLRKVPGDSSAAPRYIETIRKRGFRTVAELSHDEEVAADSCLEETPFPGLAPCKERHSGWSSTAQTLSGRCCA